MTVQAAVHEIEHTLSPRYPQHFTNIDAAKRYVKKLAHDANYDYTLPRNYNLQPTLSHPTVRDVKNRACFIVAIRAYDQGEFYLNEALPDRESLRSISTPPHSTSLSIPHLPYLSYPFSFFWKIHPKKITDEP